MLNRTPPSSSRSLKVFKPQSTCRHGTSVAQRFGGIRPPRVWTPVRPRQSTIRMRSAAKPGGMAAVRAIAAPAATRRPMIMKRPPKRENGYGGRHTRSPVRFGTWEIWPGQSCNASHRGDLHWMRASARLRPYPVARGGAPTRRPAGQAALPAGETAGATGGLPAAAAGRALDDATASDEAATETKRPMISGAGLGAFGAPRHARGRAAIGRSHRASEDRRRAPAEILRSLPADRTARPAPG